MHPIWRKLRKVKEFQIEHNELTIKGQRTVKYIVVTIGQTMSGEQMAKRIIKS